MALGPERETEGNREPRAGRVSSETALPLTALPTVELLPAAPTPFLPPNTQGISTLLITQAPIS